MVAGKVCRFVRLENPLHMPDFRWLTCLVLALHMMTASRLEASPVPVVDRLLEAYEKARNFRGTVQVTEYKGRDRSTMRFLLILEKPNRTAVTILDSPQARHTEGARLVWFGGKNIEVRASILGVPLRVTTDVEDDRLRDFRGYSNADLTIWRAIQTIGDARTRIEALHPVRVEPEDRHLEWVSIRSPRLLRDIEEERIGLDPRDHLPRVREMVSAGTRVYRLVVEKGEFDVDLPASSFDLSR